MTKAKKKNYYNRIPINDNAPVEDRPKSAKRLEDDAVSKAIGDRRRRIEEMADEQALRREMKDWNYV